MCRSMPQAWAGQCRLGQRDADQPWAMDPERGWVCCTSSCPVPALLQVWQVSDFASQHS